MSDGFFSPIENYQIKRTKIIQKSRSSPSLFEIDEQNDFLFLSKSEEKLRFTNQEEFNLKESKEKLNLPDIFEKLIEKVTSLRFENQKLMMENDLIKEKKEKEIDEISNNLKIHDENYYVSSSEKYFGEKRCLTIELLMKDVGEERSKMESRIDILKDALDAQRKDNEENIEKIGKKLENEKEEKINKELNILYSSQQTAIAKSLDFLELNEEKLDYYQNLCLHLKEELENIEISHKKEIYLLKELTDSQHEQKLENLKDFYEKKLKKLENENKTTFQKQNDDIDELHALVKSLLHKISILETNKQIILTEKKKVNQEMLKLYTQNQNLQNTIEELIPKHEFQLQKMQSKYFEEKKFLDFEIKTLRKKNFTEETFESQVGKHKKHFSHDIKEISEWNNQNNPNLALELSDVFDKSEVKKTCYYFKNSIVESLRTSSHNSVQERINGIKRESERKRNNDLKTESEFIKSFISLDEKGMAKTCINLNEKDFRNSTIKKSAQPKISKLKSSTSFQLPLSNINIFNQINQTFILDSSILMNGNFFKNENLDLESFNEAYYIQENEKTINKIAKEVQIKNSLGIMNSPDQKKSFINLKRFAKNLFNEHILIMKELLKKTLDKFDSYSLSTLLFFDLIAIKINNYYETENGHIEYNIELYDKILDKSWKFDCRYSKLRRLHLETKFSLALEGNLIKIAEFPPRNFFGNKNPNFLEHRKRKIQAYFDNYIKNKNSNVILEKGILRYFFYREIWREIEKSHSKKLEEIEEMKLLNDVTFTQIIIKINEVFEEIKHNLALLNRNEALIFIYYQNKIKAISMQDPIKSKIDKI